MRTHFCCRLLAVGLGLTAPGTARCQTPLPAPAAAPTNSLVISPPPPLPPMPPPRTSRPAIPYGWRTSAPPPQVLRPIPVPRPLPLPRVTPTSTAATPMLQPFPLTFDSDLKEATAKPGDTNLVFHWRLTNATPAEVTIDRVQTSCGCTTARLPSLPWKVAAGTNGEFDVVLDVRGKRGQVTKMVYVYCTGGFKALTIRATIPEPVGAMTGDRLRNQQLAVGDRQAVFKGDCARCHAEPGKGKQGRELFQAVCGVCHEATQRAAMVPDLRVLNHPTPREHWQTWAAYGKAGTLMPAFAQSEGGPLSDDQIQSLVDYLVQHIPSRLPGVAPSHVTE